MSFLVQAQGHTTQQQVASVQADRELPWRSQQVKLRAQSSVGLQLPLTGELDNTRANLTADRGRAILQRAFRLSSLVLTEIASTAAVAGYCKCFIQQLQQISTVAAALEPEKLVYLPKKQEHTPQTLTLARLPKKLTWTSFLPSPHHNCNLCSIQTLHPKMLRSCSSWQCWTLLGRVIHRCSCRSKLIQLDLVVKWSTKKERKKLSRLPKTTRLNPSILSL
mmetsp:Transcript_48366/g.94880  ORF Transcript_48366/g.94880 Transcript_48366/m.94880 type:complete len:221 (-) Transcript_48366:261-923(-)